MNYLDIGVLVLVALCAFAGYRQGLVRTVYRLASFFIALILANILYPHVADFLRGSVIFTSIQNSIKRGLNLESFVTEHATMRQAEIIDSLPIPMPAQLRELLHARVESDISGILRVDTIEEYISAFFADIAINGIAIVAVFLLVLIILSIAGGLINIVGKLPIIRTFNNWGGFAFGIIMGAGISWISIIVISMFFATSANPEFYDLLQNSFFARIVLDSMLTTVS